MDSLSPSLAFLAGNLAVVNPRGCATFPAFLSFYVGAETTYVGAETTLPSMRGRMAQGLVVGLSLWPVREEEQAEPLAESSRSASSL